MKNSLFILLLLISFTVFARGGDEVLNGGGIAEQYLHHAFKLLPKILPRCQTTHGCASSPEQQDALRLLNNSMAKEQELTSLKFLSEKMNPGFFIRDGAPRLAVTGNQVGDPIYFNTDLLYQNGQAKIDLGYSIQILIHELGHHQGISHHDFLDSLGASIRLSTIGITSEAPYLPHTDEMAAVGLELNSYTQNGSLLIIFKDRAIDATDLFTNLAQACIKEGTSINPLVSSALQFYNLNWQHNPKQLLDGPKHLIGNAIVYCRHQHYNDYRLFFEFDLVIETGFTDRYFYKSHRLSQKPKFLLKNIQALTYK